jgi:predicted ABC-type transport system involved in lysophospholipase L1 biosynthesis ATPase subunit
MVGEFVVLLGQSGSGKSTLLNLVSGIEQPTMGRITIDGVCLSESNERRALLRRDRIGFIFQFFNLIPHADGVGKYYPASRVGRGAPSRSEKESDRAPRPCRIGRPRSSIPRQAFGGTITAGGDAR